MSVFDPKSIDPLSLPSVPLNGKDKLPTSPGIYFALSATGKILYIGRAGEFKSRWRDHRHYPVLYFIEKVRVAYWKLDSKNNLSDIEQELINFHKPPLNNRTSEFKDAMLALLVEVQFSRWSKNIEDSIKIQLESLKVGDVQTNLRRHEERMLQRLEQLEFKLENPRSISRSSRLKLALRRLKVISVTAFLSVCVLIILKFFILVLLPLILETATLVIKTAFLVITTATAICCVYALLPEPLRIPAVERWLYASTQSKTFRFPYPQFNSALDVDESQVDFSTLDDRIKEVEGEVDSSTSEGD